MKLKVAVREGTIVSAFLEGDILENNFFDGQDGEVKLSLSQQNKPVAVVSARVHNIEIVLADDAVYDTASPRHSLDEHKYALSHLRSLGDMVVHQQNVQDSVEVHDPV